MAFFIVLYPLISQNIKSGDRVVKVIPQNINEGLEMNRHYCSSKRIDYVSVGEQTTPATRKSAGILALAKDWKTSVYLELELKFPQHITTPTLHPDVVF